MKYLSLLLISALILNSCGKDKTASTATVIASNDLELIRQKKAELDTKSQEISEQLKQLEKSIKALDPQSKIPLITTFAAKTSVFEHYV